MTAATSSAAGLAKALIGDRSEQLLDIAGDALGLVLRRVSLDDLAVAVDQELGEIPFDRLGAQKPGLRVLEILVDGRRVVSVHVDLGKKRERDAVIDLAERFDLFLASRLLAPVMDARN